MTTIPRKLILDVDNNIIVECSFESVRNYNIAVGNTYLVFIVYENHVLFNKIYH